jgi:hypothetical protein
VTLVNEACTVIAHFGHGIFTGTVQYPNYIGIPGFSLPPLKKPVDNPANAVNDCKKLFDNLSLELKYQLIHKRLELCDNLEMHGGKRK